jgi:hypothetical protein
MVNKKCPLRATKMCRISISLSLFLWSLASLVTNMQHKNVVFEILSLEDVFSNSYCGGQPKTFYVRVVFSEKSGKMYILPFAIFVAFWSVSLLCCYLST